MYSCIFFIFSSNYTSITNYLIPQCSLSIYFCISSANDLFLLWCLGALHVAACKTSRGVCSPRSHAIRIFSCLNGRWGFGRTLLVRRDIKNGVRQIIQWSSCRPASVGQIWWESCRNHCKSLICTHSPSWNFAAFRFLNFGHVRRLLIFYGTLWNDNSLIEIGSASMISSFGCLKDGLHFLDFIPRLEIILGVNCVLSASSIKLFWVIRQWN